MVNYHFKYFFSFAQKLLLTSIFINYEKNKKNHLFFIPSPNRNNMHAYCM